MGGYSVSLHLSVGAEMLAACAVLEKRPRLWGITVLTSFDEYGLFRAGYRYGIDKTVKTLAALGLENGADGVVCSPHEVGMLKELHGGKLSLVTPGIRPAALGDDQKRAMTPAEARAAGSDFIVVGRPIIAAADRAAAAAAVLEDLK
jgi:orotidine-5'-phosphate decarboxylase